MMAAATNIKLTFLNSNKLCPTITFSKLIGGGITNEETFNGRKSLIYNLSIIILSTPLLTAKIIFSIDEIINPIIHKTINPKKANADLLKKIERNKQIEKNKLNEKNELKTY